MGEIAYTVRSEYASGGFEGGDMAVGETTFHLGEALDKGAGYVVIDESENMYLTLRLSEQLALRQCPVAEARKAQVDARKTSKQKAAD